MPLQQAAFEKIEPVELGVIHQSHINTRLSLKITNIKQGAQSQTDSSSKSIKMDTRKTKIVQPKMTQGKEEKIHCALCI